MRLAVALLAVSAVAADWPRFLGPAGDGSSPETGILTQWPRDGLKKVWEAKLGEGFAPPTVAAGKLYHFDLFDKAARVTCREAVTGKQLWTHDHPTEYRDQYGYDGGRCNPTVDGDRVYMFGPDGMLACLSAADGSERWSLDTHAKYRVQPNFFGVGGCPLVDGDTLLVPVGGSPPGARPVDFRDVKPNGSAIVGLDKLTGTVKFAAGDELSSYATPTIVTVGGKRVGLYFARGGLLGFDPATGATAFRYRWRARIEESVNAANPVVAGDTVLISEGYEIGSAALKLSPTAATPVWTDRDKDRSDKALLAHWGTPVHHAGFVYGCSGRHATEADIRCVELATGEVKWVQRRTARCTFLKVDGHVLSLSEQGEFRLFRLNSDKYDEAARWECPDLDYPCWAPPILIDGRLYVRGKDRLVCYELIPKR